MANRSVWKGPYAKDEFFRSIRALPQSHIKTTSRNTTILPFLIGKIVQIHNGKFFFPITIVEDMVGHKLGEFIATRIRHSYKKKKKVKK